MIVLASKSASRRAMLDAAGIAYEAIPARIDERAVEAELPASGPEAVASALALAKAEAVSDDCPGRLVLGSDSLVVVNGRRFDKPGSREEAAEHLRVFSGQEMRLYSAAALVRDGDAIWQGGGMASLYVTELTHSFIETYLDEEWPEVSACVGVFRIEGRGVRLFDRIEGDYFTVLGMPLLKVTGALRSIGELVA